MIGNNLKFLRKRHQYSQAGLSEALGIPRTTLGDYEREKTEPNIQMLIKMSRHFDIELEHLLTADLSNENLEVVKSDTLKVLAITVDSHNEGNIELVDTKAEAGYLDSYQDPQYIKSLPKIKFPNIPEGTYRGFEIHGDSMLPMQSGSIVICSYIESLRELKNGKTYVIISKREGLVYKRLRIDPDTDKLFLISDNTEYEPYEIAYEDIDEIWRYYAHLSFDDSQNYEATNLDQRLSDIQNKVTAIHDKWVQ